LEHYICERYYGLLRLVTFVPIYWYVVHEATKIQLVMNIPLEYSMQLTVSFNITTNQKLVNQWILVVRMDATAPVESDIIIPIKC